MDEIEINPSDWVEKEASKARIVELFREAAKLFPKAYPVTAQAIEVDAGDLRPALFHLVRSSLAEGDIEMLAMMAAWFVERADPRLLTRFSIWLEDDGNWDPIQ